MRQSDLFRTYKDIKLPESLGLREFFISKDARHILQIILKKMQKAVTKMEFMRLIDNRREVTGT